LLIGAQNLPLRLPVLLEFLERCCGSAAHCLGMVKDYRVLTKEKARVVRKESGKNECSFLPRFRNILVRSIMIYRTVFMEKIFVLIGSVILIPLKNSDLRRIG